MEEKAFKLQFRESSKSKSKSRQTSPQNDHNLVKNSTPIKQQQPEVTSSNFDSKCGAQNDKNAKECSILEEQKKGPQSPVCFEINSTAPELVLQNSNSESNFTPEKENENPSSAVSYLKVHSQSSENIQQNDQDPSFRFSQETDTQNSLSNTSSPLHKFFSLDTLSKDSFNESHEQETRNEEFLNTNMENNHAEIHDKTMQIEQGNVIDRGPSLSDKENFTKEKTPDLIRTSVQKTASLRRQNTKEVKTNECIPETDSSVNNGNDLDCAIQRTELTEDKMSDTSSQETVVFEIPEKDWSKSDSELSHASRSDNDKLKRTKRKHYDQNKAEMSDSKSLASICSPPGLISGIKEDEITTERWCTFSSDSSTEIPLQLGAKKKIVRREKKGNGDTYSSDDEATTTEQSSDAQTKFRRTHPRKVHDTRQNSKVPPKASQ